MTNKSFFCKKNELVLKLCVNEGRFRGLKLGQNCLSPLVFSVVLEKIVDHGKVVNHRAGNHEEMPDGVGKRDASVALEEDDADDVDDATEFQLEQAGLVLLLNR